MRGHVALREDGRALRVEPGREQHRGQVERALAQVGRVVVDRDRVQVDDAEERLAAAPASPRTGGSRRSSCRSASRPWAGCRRRCALGRELSGAPSRLHWTTWPSSTRPGRRRRGGTREALQQPEWPDDARSQARRASGCSALPPLVFAGEARAAAGVARRGRRRPRVPAPGRRLRRVVPRLHGGRDPREAEDPAPDGGRAHLRRGAAGAEGRADRRASSRSRARRRSSASATSSCRPSAGTWSTTTRRPPRRACPTRSGCCRPTTSRPRR